MTFSTFSRVISTISGLSSFFICKSWRDIILGPGVVKSAARSPSRVSSLGEGLFFLSKFSKLPPPMAVVVYLSNAPADCPPAELTRITGMRWPVETALEEAKGEVGLDHYETRTWQGWHHHMLQSFLAHLFLVRLRLLFQKKPCPHDRTSPSTGGGCLGRRNPAQTRSPGHPTLSPMP